ncbi:MAG: hypothetical protein M1825_006215 [Sarcosagium campestre]|nr:MAG: hypothetical protein M1825_006215 [Sarcosagium campestre]
MATPTASRSQHHHQEMTPGSFANHLAAFSPLPTAPRSVGQSPAYLSKKSPAHVSALQHQNLASSNLNGAINFDSPSAAALGLNLSLPTLESVTSTNIRADEDERRRRIETILDLLKTRPGRVSEEGVERLARRTGLECLWEDAPDGGRTLSIAGRGVLIDVDFLDNSVTRVSLSFPTSPDSLAEGAPRAAKILKDQLTPPKGVSPICTDLSPFTAHLEQLARLDKLSSPPHLNCFEAISGIYGSLRQIFEWEKERLRAEAKRSNNERLLADDEMLEAEVLCKKSGRPRMHAGKQVGLSLEYWKDQRLLPPPRRPSSAIDPDSLGPRIWSAVISCEASPAELYPSVRMSTDWVSDDVCKVNDDDAAAAAAEVEQPHIIEWLDPPPTLLDAPSTAPDGSLAPISSSSSTASLPNVRFVARLSPPVTVPLPVAYDILAAVGLQIPNESLRATTYDGLLLSGSASATTGNSGGGSGGGDDYPRATAKRNVPVVGTDGALRNVRHNASLYVQKQDFGRVIEEIPFAHPRQLVAILPVLRQYAFISTVLHNSFPPSATPSITPTTTNAPILPPSSPLPSSSSSSSSSSPPPPPPPPPLSLASLMSSTAPLPSPDAPLPLSLTLATTPTPRLTLVFPVLSHVQSPSLNQDDAAAGATAGSTTTDAASTPSEAPSSLGTVGVEIGPNAEVVLVEQDVFSVTSESDGVGSDVQKITRALEVVEDVGVWCEWMRGRKQKKGEEEGEAGNT